MDFLKDKGKASLIPPGGARSPSLRPAPRTLQAPSRPNKGTSVPPLGGIPGPSPRVGGVAPIEAAQRPQRGGPPRSPAPSRPDPSPMNPGEGPHSTSRRADRAPAPAGKPDDFPARALHGKKLDLYGLYRAARRPSSHPPPSTPLPLLSLAPHPPLTGLPPSSHRRASACAPGRRPGRVLRVEGPLQALRARLQLGHRHLPKDGGATPSPPSPRRLYEPAIPSLTTSPPHPLLAFAPILPPAELRQGQGGGRRRPAEQGVRGVSA